MSLKSNSQSSQDLFVLYCNNFKKNGTYVEIGSCDPIKMNNTYLLAKEYNWSGFMVELDKSFYELYKNVRSESYHLIKDATEIDFLDEFEKVKFPKNIDYLQIDLFVENGSTIKTLINLDNNILDTYKFAVITFEHDYHISYKYFKTDDLFNTRKLSRQIFEKRGYIMVFPDIRNTDIDPDPYEDWYIHPDLIDINLIYKLRLTTSLTHHEIINHVKNTCDEHFNKIKN